MNIKNKIEKCISLSKSLFWTFLNNIFVNLSFFSGVIDNLNRLVSDIIKLSLSFFLPKFGELLFL